MQCRKKGVSVLMSHAAFIAIGVVALIIISSMVWGIYDSIIREEIRKDLTKISQTAAREIAKLYSLKDSPAKPDLNASILLGESSLILQPKAGSRQYMIEFLQSNQITITNLSEGGGASYATQIMASTSNPAVRVNYTLYNIDSRVQGFGFGDEPLTLRYYRLNYNGNVEDRIALNSGLIIGGENVG
jgi:hypothetical protein